MGGQALTILVTAIFSGYLIVPPTVSQQLDLGDIPDLNNISSVSEWKEHCRTTAGEQAMKDIEKSIGEFMVCIQGQIKMDKLMREVNKSIERGELDLVFKKYCKKRDAFMACAEDVFAKLERCTNEQEKQDLGVVRKAIDAGIDFVCHNDGDRIALFMAEKGVDCLKNHSESIKVCVEEKVPEIKELIEDADSINLARFTLSEENCKKLNEAKECVVKYTSKCDDETPANILGSLITQMLKVTPCSQASSASALLSHTQYLLPHLLTLVAAALTAANILL